MNFAHLTEDIARILSDSRTRGLKITGAGFVLVAISLPIHILLSGTLGKAILIVGILIFLAGFVTHIGAFISPRQKNLENATTMRQSSSQVEPEKSAARQ